MKRLSQAALLAAGLVLPLASPVQAAPKPTPSQSPAPAKAVPGLRAAVKTVKLPTGDRVRVQNGTVIGIDPGPGRGHITFQQAGHGDDLIVLPSDAVQRGMDPRRFRLSGSTAPLRRTAAAATDHSFTLNVLGRQGKPVNASAFVTSRDDPMFGLWIVRAGEEERLPAGRYSVTAFTSASDKADPRLLLSAPDVRVDDDMTLTLDGRRARRVKLGVARPTARAGNWAAGTSVKAAPGARYAREGSVTFVPDDGELYADVVDPGPDFAFDVHGVFTEPPIRVDAGGDAPFPVDVRYAQDEDGLRSPTLLGVLDLKAVNGGAGTPDDLKDAAGALVVLDPSAGDTPLPEKVQNVANAGGRAVLLSKEAPSYSGDLALPTLEAETDAGARLRTMTETAPVPVTTHGIESSPYSYNVVHPTIGGIPDNPVYVDRDEDLVAGRVTYRAPGGPGTATVAPGADLGDLEFGSFGEQIHVPTTRTEYVTPLPGLKYSRVLMGVGDGTPYVGSGSHEYRLGDRFSDTMFKGVMGPWLATPPEPMKGALRPAWIFRKGDTIDVSVPTFSDDRPDHIGGNYADTEASAGLTRLYRNGALVGENTDPGQGQFQVPAEPGAYKLDVAAKVGDKRWQTTTGVHTSWTFTSAGSSATTPLPLMAVRFSPWLNDLNQGPAGKDVAIPVRVGHQAGSSASPVASLVVKASFDDGAHWSPVPVVRDGDHWVARLRNPGSGTVSLRAIARDTAGATVDQTIDHAYTVK